MKTRHTRTLAAIAAPLALMIAGCSGDEKDGEIAEQERIAPIPAPDGSSWVDTASVTEMDGYVIGNPDAPIKLVEYASHTCGACAHFSEEGSAKLNNDYVASGRVSWEIRNQVHDPLDLTIAVLARCGGPEAFHPLSEQVWANLSSITGNIEANPQAYENAMNTTGAARLQGIAQAAGLYDFFAERGISQDQAKQCLADEKKSETIVANSNSQSKEFNITGTPQFIMNGKQIGTQDWKSLEPMLQRAGAR